MDIGCVGIVCRVLRCCFFWCVCILIFVCDSGCRLIVVRMGLCVFLEIVVVVFVILVLVKVI